MEWKDYISKLLSDVSSFDGVSLSLYNSEKPTEIPPIIKASIFMLDRMQECQGEFNIFVFPERIQSIFIFTLVKLLYNISEGKIDHVYDPSSFKEGDRLSFGKAVVEFVALEEINGKKRMKIRLAENLTISASVEYFPLFQYINTRKKLSTNKQYVEAQREAEKLLSQISSAEKILNLLMDHKTHMESSIVNMTSVIKTKELISGCKICGCKFKDVVLVGQADYEGNIKNIGAGQLSGVPAIVLASDLYAIQKMASRGHPIQSIIIDASNTNALLSQLPALDELMRLGVPITCVTDIVNSFDLQEFLNRGFNLWRWDETSITKELYNATELTADRKIKHCAKRKVEYLMVDDKAISDSIRLLYMNRKESQTASAQMLRLFNDLYSIAFIALRATVPLDEVQRVQARNVLEECNAILANEKIFLPEKIYNDYSTILKNLKKVFEKNYIFQKHEVLADKLMDLHGRKVALVVPEKSDKKQVLKYWQDWCCKNYANVQIDAYYPAEYYLIPSNKYTWTIVVGWLKRAIMRKIMYSFNTEYYAVLLNDCEKGWKNHDTLKWDTALNRDETRKTVEKSFTTDKIRISTSRFVPTVLEVVDTPESDELNEIEIILRENKYRQYIANGGNKSAHETIEAIPVNYVGGYLAFYRTGHKVISASDIIFNDGDKIEEILPNKLKMGDFVVVREADRDLVKEMADIILERSGYKNLRELATKWKEVLEIETLFYSYEEIYERLQDVGCTKSYQAVRSWIVDEGKIAPQDKQDLEYIAKMTGSAVLKEMLDQIYDAAQMVKSAHVQAGRMLSAQLRNRVVEALTEYGDIDPFNIWDPIEMQVDGIGLVRILKIIDIGEPVIVDIADTNRLIEE